MLGPGGARSAYVQREELRFVKRRVKAWLERLVEIKVLTSFDTRRPSIGNVWIGCRAFRWANEGVAGAWVGRLHHLLASLPFHRLAPGPPASAQADGLCRRSAVGLSQCSDIIEHLSDSSGRRLAAKVCPEWESPWGLDLPWWRPSP